MFCLYSIAQLIPSHTKKYLNNALFLECDRNKDYGILFNVACAIIPLLLAIPVIYLLVISNFSARAKSHQTYANNVNYWRYFTQLYSCYKEQYYLWEVILYLKSLFFAAILSLVPSNSPFLALGIFLVILSFSLLHSWLMPFKEMVTNVLNIAADAVIMLTYMSGVLFSIPTYSRYSQALGILLFFLHVMIVFAYGSALTIKTINTNWRIIPGILQEVLHIMRSFFLNFFAKLREVLRKCCKIIGNFFVFMLNLLQRIPPVHFSTSEISMV